MIWRGNLHLPDELVGKLPPFITEAIVAFAGIGFAVGMRVVLQQMVPDVAPFALSFPAIAAVTLLAGARAGAMTLVGCQLLIWYAILPPQRSFAIESVTTAVNLVLVTITQMLLLWAVAAYRRLAIAGHDEDRQRIDDLSLTLREIDHRTKNNFQLAVGMLEIQARNATDEVVRSSLGRAAARLQAIGGVYKNLALSSADLEAVRLHDYLRDICDRLREGLLSPAVVLEFDAEPATVGHELAIRIGLIVNELVTNAAKHAFPDGLGKVVVKLETAADGLLLSVSDDGKGLGENEKGMDGLGTKLIGMLTRQIGATSTIQSKGGTHYVIAIPHAKIAR